MAQPELNESHIHEVPKKSGLIFHMVEVSKVCVKQTQTIVVFSMSQLYSSI